VRRQQRLDRIIGPLERELEPLVAQEKSLRKQIDTLLVAAGLGHLDRVTVNGFEVTHNKRKGVERLDQDVLALFLTAHGVDGELVAEAICQATDTGDDVIFATVRPEKGAAVVRRRLPVQGCAVKPQKGTRALTRAA
jgi:hypothetical protein